MSPNAKRLVWALLFFIWMAFVVAAFFVVQKPDVLKVWRGLADTLWSLVVWGLLAVNGLGLGHFLLRKLPGLSLTPVERFLIGMGVGLGLLGLLGFLFGWLGWVHQAVWFGCQLGLLLVLWQQKILRAVRRDGRALKQEWLRNMATAPAWVKIALGWTFLLAFLLALAPPAEAFDALFYHLPRNERVLAGVSWLPSSVPHFWFPALPEDVFLWAQGLGAVRVSQLLHLTWMALGAFLIWYWASEVWDARAGQASLVILISMPSLHLLAAWAYTDFALTFYGLGALYGVYKAHQNPIEQPLGWILLAGIAAGMAMGVKYTSFLIPVSGMFLILWWQRENWKLALKTGLVFGLTAVLLASPWYLRNGVVMGNPVYPFAFGGLHWDAFRAQAYAEVGSGIGWNPKEWLLLPLNITLGYRDANYFDGRIGPLYLVLAPLAGYIIFTSRKTPRPQRRAIFAIAIFALLSIAAWVFGVINSAALWQARLLFPVLFLLAIPAALGWLALQKLDTPQLRISFIFNAMVIFILSINLINASLNVILRNPLAYAVGIETRADYLEKVQPAYAQALELVAETPEDAQIYSLFEPRSYYMPRTFQPDSILDNFSHDMYLFGTSERIVAAWQAEGYTHILLYRRGAEFLQDHPLKFSAGQQAALDAIIRHQLEWLGTTPDGEYELYRIAPGGAP